MLRIFKSAEKIETDRACRRLRQALMINQIIETQPARESRACHRINRSLVEMGRSGDHPAIGYDELNNHEQVTP